MAPVYLQEKFTFKITGYGLRQKDKLSLPKPNTENCRRTFYYRGCTLYNDLPVDTRNLNTLNSFNTEIKRIT